MAEKPLRLGVFSPSVLIEVARRTGAFDAARLEVEEIPVSSSPAQFGMLANGEIDAAFTSPDNVFAYRESAANPLGRRVRTRIAAAVDRGLGLSLFGSAEAGGTGLTGGVLAVDAPGTGFAIVAYELLARRGLGRGRDYTVEAQGTTPARADAIIAGRCRMTVLNAGSDLRAEAAGCRRLARASTLGSYVGTVLAVLDDAHIDTGAHTDTHAQASGLADSPFLHAVLATSRRIVAGDFHALAVEIAEARLRLARPEAERYAATLADPVEGLVPDGRLDPEAVATLRRLREAHIAPGRTLRMCDDRHSAT